ncbi:MAG: hypothetical protein KC493_05410 [Bacteriovoracaceae bacterium]|nr:hypothetical protein [Bacteriovoracaceae bacterium]
MRICFYSDDAQIADLASSLEGIEVSTASTMDEVQACVNSSEEKLLLFIDLDGDSEQAHLINQTLFEDSSVIRIIITETTSLKDLKKHQLSDEAAFGYIKKPMTGELVAGLVNDFELADYVEDNNLIHEGDKAVEDVELTFVGLKKSDLEEMAAAQAGTEETSSDD